MLREIGAVTGMSLRSLPQRVANSAVIVIGIAGVVGVLVAVLAMAEGFRETLQQTGDANTAIVLRGGATAELSSGVGRDEVTLIEQLPGILKDAQGKPIASPELVVVANIPKKGTNTDANVEIRGVGEQAFALRPRKRQQRTGIDRKAHEIDARGAQGREIATHRDRAPGLERRPVVVRAGRRKLAGQGEPRPEIHAAAQARSA